MAWSMVEVELPNHEKTYDVVDADGGLIAPEMLEALKYEVEYAGECELDHNGFCQAHGLGRDENGKPDCHVAWYRLIIAKVEGTHGE